MKPASTPRAACGPRAEGSRRGIAAGAISTLLPWLALLLARLWPGTMLVAMLLGVIALVAAVAGIVFANTGMSAPRGVEDAARAPSRVGLALSFAGLASVVYAPMYLIADPSP